MRLQKQNLFKNAMVICLLLAGNQMVYADDITLSGNTFFANGTTGDSVVLTVTGPANFSYANNNGLVDREPSGPSGLAPAAAPALLMDGLYHYEIAEYTTNGQRVVNDPATGRTNAVQKIISSVTIRKGKVLVSNGVIVELPDIQEE